MLRRSAKSPDYLTRVLIVVRILVVFAILIPVFRGRRVGASGDKYGPNLYYKQQRPPPSLHYSDHHLW